MSDIQIILNSPQSIYCPGDKLKGYVLVNLPKDKKVDEIRLQANGRAHVDFLEVYGANAIMYKNDEVYFDDYLTLSEKEAKDDESLSADSKQYPFSLTIPSDIAPSFEGLYGDIRYSLKAELDLPWALDKYCEVEIPVAIPVDLKSASKLSQPQSSTIQKHSIFPCSKSLKATVSIPRLVWTANETIPINCSVKNHSSHEISSIEVSIIRNERYTGQTDLLYDSTTTKDSSKNVYSTKTDVVIPAKTSKKVQVDFRVPTNLFSIINCPIIKVDYELEIKLHSNKIFSSTTHTFLPVVFSNVPFIQ